jgi:hypothetical protein
MVIIGYSLPDHDDYARQFIYRAVTNYQEVLLERVDPTGGKRGKKEPIVFVGLCKKREDQTTIQKRYRFVDWSRARSFFHGFNQDVIAAL